MGGIPRLSTRLCLSVNNEWLEVETGRLNPPYEPRLSGANGNREIFIFFVQLSTSRIGNLTRFIYNLLYLICDDYSYSVYSKVKLSTLLRISGVSNAFVSIY